MFVIQSNSEDRIVEVLQAAKDIFKCDLASFCADGIHGFFIIKEFLKDNKNEKFVNSKRIQMIKTLNKLGFIGNSKDYWFHSAIVKVRSI